MYMMYYGVTWPAGAGDDGHVVGKRVRFGSLHAVRPGAPCVRHRSRLRIGRTRERARGPRVGGEMDRPRIPQRTMMMMMMMMMKQSCTAELELELDNWPFVSPGHS
jgi:hypothetical protein